MKILWGITGAGHLLKESLDVLDTLSDEHEVTVLKSAAGKEVVQLYGYSPIIDKIMKKNKKNQTFEEKDEKYSFPFSGKITYNKYDLVVIAPTTANTVAKVVNGFADSLITNVIAQSGKGEIPLLILPVDQKEGPIKTKLPLFLDTKMCRKCKVCNAALNCPTGAISNQTIDQEKCIGCKNCKRYCIFKAIISEKVITLNIRKIDAENTKKLDTIDNIQTVFDPTQIIEYVESMQT